MNNSTTVNGTNVTYVLNVTAASPHPSGFPADFKIGVTLAYAVIFLIALFGNSFGLFVVLKKSSSSSVTNLFIANMAVADLLLTITVMPFSVSYMYMFRKTLWIGGTLGNITCKAVFYVMPVSISAAILTMTLISINRFYAVFYPLKGTLFQKPKVLSGIIWILSFVLMIPYVFWYRINFIPSLDAFNCSQDWPWEYSTLKSFHICVFVILYVASFLLMSIIYFLICCKLWFRKIPGNVTDSNRASAERYKRKVVRLLVIVCVVFALCWFPTYVNHYFWYVRPDKLYMFVSDKVQVTFYFLAHANSAINPCLYILLSEKFRKDLFTFLTCCSAFGFGNRMIAVTAPNSACKASVMQLVEGQNIAALSYIKSKLDDGVYSKMEPHNRR